VGDFSIRLATAADAEACSDVYRPYVQATALTFETAVPTVSEFAARITSATATHAWLVLERGGVVVGYASSRTFDERDAYRWSCETGLYLTSASHGNGGGHLLYAALLDQLAARGYDIAYLAPRHFAWRVAIAFRSIIVRTDKRIALVCPAITRDSSCGSMTAKTPGLAPIAPSSTIPGRTDKPRFSPVW
jgi:L-amino acid N-acyltransferase YncA